MALVTYNYSHEQFLQGQLIEEYSFCRDLSALLSYLLNCLYLAFCYVAGVCGLDRRSLAEQNSSVLCINFGHVSPNHYYDTIRYCLFNE